MLVALALDYASFTLPIVDSFELATSLDNFAACFGVMVGAGVLGRLLGQFWTWRLFRCTPEIWRAVVGLVVVLSGMFCIGVSVAARAGVTMAAPGQGPRLWALVFARLFGGLGSGLVGQLAALTFQHLIPPEQRPTQMIRFYSVITLGVGLGPIIAAAMKGLDPCHGAPPIYSTAGLAHSVLSLAAFVAVAWLLPCLAQEPQHVALAVKAASPPEQTGPTAVLASLAMSVTWCFIAAGLEGASSTLLGESYGCSQASIWLAIGATLLTCNPLWLFYLHSEDLLSRATLARVLAGAGLVGGVLLFHAPRFTGERLILRSEAVALLVTDVFLFPTLYFSESSVSEVRSDKSQPSGSLFGASSFPLIAIFTCDAVARFFGPQFAQLAIEVNVRTMYAVLQVVAVIAYMVAFKFGVAPRVKKT